MSPIQLDETDIPKSLNLRAEQTDAFRAARTTRRMQLTYQPALLPALGDVAFVSGKAAGWNVWPSITEGEDCGPIATP